VGDNGEFRGFFQRLDGENCPCMSTAHGYHPRRTGGESSRIRLCRLC